MAQLSAQLKTSRRAGFVFDYSADGSFKYAALDATARQVVVGHYTPGDGWVRDAVYAKKLSGRTVYAVDLIVTGTTVSVMLNGNTVVSYTFSGATMAGRYGLFATRASGSFDDVRIRTNDPSPGSQTLAVASVTASGPAAEGEAATARVRMDVDGNGTVAPLDALLLVNYLNGQSPGDSSGEPALDVNADSLITALDALLVINQVNVRAAAFNAQPAAEGETDKEGFLFSAQQSENPLLGIAAADEGVVALLAEDQHLGGRKDGVYEAAFGLDERLFNWDSDSGDWLS